MKIRFYLHSLSGILVFLTLTNFSVSGQSKTIQVWDTLEPGKYEYIAVGELAKLHSKNDTVAYYKYRELIENKFKKDKSILGEKILLNFDGIRHTRALNHDSARMIFMKAIELCEKTRDSFNYAANISMIGTLDYMKGDFLNAINHWRKSVEMYNPLSDSAKISSNLTNIATGYLQISYFRSSFEYFQKALNFFPENSKAYENYWVTRINMSVAISKSGGINQAMKILNEIPATELNEHIRFLTYLNKAHLFSLMENADSFYLYIDSSEFYLKSNLPYSLNFKQTKIDALLKLKNTEAAKALLEELKPELLNDFVNPTFKLSAYKTFAKLTDKVMFDLNMLSEMESVFERNHNLGGLIEVFELKTIIFKQEEKLDLALVYAFKTDSLKNILHEEELNTQFLDYAEKYQSIQLSEENVALKEDIFSVKNTLEKSKILVFVLIISGLFLLISLIWSIVNFRKSKSISNRENTLLDKEKSLKEIQLKELENKFNEQEKELNQTVAMLINVRQLENNLMNLIQDVNSAHDLRQLQKSMNSRQIELNKFRENHNSFLIEQTLQQKLKGFTDKLTLRYPVLTEREKVVAGLIRAGFSSKEIGNMLNRSEKNIENNRTQIRKKMELTPDIILNESLKAI